MSEPVNKRVKQNELFTREECIQVLEKMLSKSGEGQGQLIEYEVVSELSSIGFLGEYFHLHLRYRTENSNEVQGTRLFVKSIPYQNADMSVFIEKSGMMKKEITLYGSLLNELKAYSRNVWCADSYLARKDLFVMQNITDLGYATLDCESGFLDKAHMLPLLKGLATMHASSIAYELEHKVSIGVELKDTLIEVTVLPSVVWYTAGLRAILDVALDHPKFQTEVMQNFIKHELPGRLHTVYDMVNPSSKHRNVFCHRDVWGGNIFYHKKQPFDFGCIFVDYQLSRYSPPALDVLLALYMNMKPRERKACILHCCQYYYDCFAQELADMGVNAAEELCRNDFEQSLKDFELFGASYNCLAATVLRLPDNFLKNLKDNHPVEFHRFTNVERTQDVKDLMCSNIDFRTYMLDCIEDMLEVVLK